MRKPVKRDENGKIQHNFVMGGGGNIKDPREKLFSF